MRQRIVRRFVLIMPLATSLFGCSTEPKTVAPGIGLFDDDHVDAGPLVQRHANTQPDIPFPKMTAFDDDPEARNYYMAAFEDGYRNALRGGHGVICLFGRDGRRGIATEIGYMEGQMAGDKFKSERDLKRALEQSPRIKESSK